MEPQRRRNGLPRGRRGLAARGKICDLCDDRIQRRLCISHMTGQRLLLRGGISASRGIGCLLFRIAFGERKQLSNTCYMIARKQRLRG